MNVPKVNLKVGYSKWCADFMEEQSKSTRMVRGILKKTKVFNPLGNFKNIDNILKRYEKSFW